VGIVLVAGIVVLAATDVPDRLEAQYQRFASGDATQTGDQRDRLTGRGADRRDHWRVSLDFFSDAPFKGQGAGTYAVLWAQQRPTDGYSDEGHSLYLEQMAELGVVGAGLLVVALLAMLIGVGLKMRGRERPVYAAIFAAMLCWAVAVGVDWHWEIPAVTLWVFILGGAALAASPGRARQSLRSLPRVVLAIGLVALAATPALVALSQSHLTKSVEAFRRGDCRTAAQQADSSLSALDVRAEPYELLAFCDARSGRARPSIEAIRAAVNRDPHNWEYRYDLAFVRARAGRDPRSSLRSARRLNPKEPKIRLAIRRFSRGGPPEWRRAARELDPAVR
jgi:hypothetical protein